jgi:hypothetical protein
MYCPNCGSEASTGATHCGSCGWELSRRSGGSRSAEASDASFAERAALRAYRLSIFGLIPLAGLALGPIAVVLGILARGHGRKDPAFTAHGPAAAAVVLGAVDAATNWLGVALIAWSLFPTAAS